MSVFTEEELSYLRQQMLGRLATVSPRGEPHVAPVAFTYTPATDTIDIGGHRLSATKKYRDAVASGKVAFVVDDLDRGPDGRGWNPHGIEVRGMVEVRETGGERLGPGFGPIFLRVRPTRIISWGINPGDRRHYARSIQP